MSEGGIVSICPFRRGFKIDEIFSNIPMNVQTKVVAYFKESIEELRKVSWPSRNEIIRNTLGVIIISLCIAAVIGIMDYLFNLGLQRVLRI